MCVCVCSCVTSWPRWSCRNLRCCWESTGWDQTSTTSAPSCCSCTATTASSCCWVSGAARQRAKPWRTATHRRHRVCGGVAGEGAPVCLCCLQLWVNRSFLLLSEEKRRFMRCSLLVLSVLCSSHHERFSSEGRRNVTHLHLSDLEKQFLLNSEACNI